MFEPVWWSQETEKEHVSSSMPVRLTFSESADTETKEIQGSFVKVDFDVEGMPQPQSIQEEVTSGSREKDEIQRETRRGEWRKHWGWIPLMLLIGGGGFMIAEQLSVQPQSIPALDPMETVTTQIFRPTKRFKPTMIVVSTKTRMQSPTESQATAILPCIPQCEQLIDLELLIDAIQEHCKMEESNSGDCMRLLWCVVCQKSLH
jgi:hypothetical protein